MGLEVKVAHRNLKPENLLLASDSKSYIISDFELSMMLSKNISSEGNNIKDSYYGSLVYMACEVFNNYETS